MANKDLDFQSTLEKTGFKDEDVSILKTAKGLSEEVIREISSLKNEPSWMLEYRLKALEAFNRLPLPSYGPDLSGLDFQSYTYFTRPAEKESKDWNAIYRILKPLSPKLKK